MIVDKPIDEAIKLVLENQIAIMYALCSNNIGTRSTLHAHISSAEAAIEESDRLRRAEARDFLRG